MEQSTKREPRLRTWAEIHMGRLAHNYKALRSMAPGSRFMGLVKANAYGHGAVPIAFQLEQMGAEYLAVACLDEAVELRQAGIQAPILILGYTPAGHVSQMIQLNLTQTVYDLELATQMAREACICGGKLKCHLKADTGMSRLGVLCTGEALESGAETLAKIAALPGLEPEGIFTHFAEADTSPEYTKIQLDTFNALLDKLKEKGYTFPLVHCANAAALITCPEAQFNMVRPGIALYGYNPEPSMAGKIDLLPVMELKTRVAEVKALPKGTPISYGRTYTLERDSQVAVLAAGYGDGLPRLLSGKQDMLLFNTRLPQIGRVCMDMCMVDVTDFREGVRVGDIATIFGDGLPLQEKADALGTITYELLCAVAHRVPRIYMD